MNREAFAAGLASIGLELSNEQFEAFERFEEALYETNEVMNLTRITREECYIRHFLDSLLFHDLIPSGADVLDIGTGPGFPAWPLAVARPDLQMTAVDSNGKMLGFLKENAVPNLMPIQYRAEEWGVREAFGVVTGRAVAPLPIQLEISAAPCEVGGLVLPMRTSTDMEAIQRMPVDLLGLKLEKIVDRVLPGTDITRLFPVYRKVSEGSPKYPRRWAEIKLNPIGSKKLWM